MTIYVRHVRDMPAEPSERHVYVGRAMPRRKLAGSPLGNPFRLEHEADRARVLARYKLWLMGSTNEAAVARSAAWRLVDLARTGDLWLYCWCSPRICHGDAVKEWIELALALAPQHTPIH